MSLALKYVRLKNRNHSNERLSSNEKNRQPLFTFSLVILSGLQPTWIYHKEKVKSHGQPHTRRQEGL